MRLLIAILLAASSAYGQVTVSGRTWFSGNNQLRGSSQYTHIWAFNPPAYSTSMTSDYYYFTNDVMPLSVIDGVSVLEEWANIETAEYPPTTTPCIPSDICQPDLGAPGYYHTYDWTYYDSATSATGMEQWFGSFGRTYKPRVNILISPAEAGATNPDTPPYVTESWWAAAFPSGYNRQDVVNYPLDMCSEWVGTSTATSTLSRTTAGVVSVTSWPGTAYTSLDTLYGDGFMPGDYAPQNGTVVMPISGGFKYQSQCSSGTCSTGAPSVYGYLISAAESWPVPYEYPFKYALMAFWAAAVAHYGPSYPYYSQINYLRFGGAEGSEWIPYCTSNLNSLGSPYTFTYPTPPTWLNYYSEMTAYLQGLDPPFQVINSIDGANGGSGLYSYCYADTEAGIALGSRTGFGSTFGFGNQGLSALDAYNCIYPPNTCPACPPSTGTHSSSDWYPLFREYNVQPVPLELQQLSLSYPGDTNCMMPTCASGNGNFSGDLPTWLSLATGQGATDIEIYWRDLELAYDATHYCQLPPMGYTCALMGVR